MGFVYSSVLDGEALYHTSQVARAQITNYEEFLIALFLYNNYKDALQRERVEIVEELRKSPGEVFTFFNQLPHPEDPVWFKALEAIGVVTANFKPGP